jgi:hypothetical protein
MKDKILSLFISFLFLLFLTTFSIATAFPNTPRGSQAGPTHPDKTAVVICFDVEDYVTPASEGVDDIPKWLADIMTEEKVTGTFFVIGEKARSLKKRGREDVIRAMARHDIGSHTDRGSIHPTITEILESAGWTQGVDSMLTQESRGVQELERIFGKPVCTLGRHGGSYGPQLVGALAKMDVGFVYSPLRLPGHNAVWFCNTLNFYGSYGGYDDTYYRDDFFDPLFDTLRGRFSEEAAGVDVYTFFACHPCKIRTVQFWDFNYYGGVNPDPSQLKMPELRPRETMGTARKNFRRLIRFLKERSDIELTTFADLMKKFSYQRDTAPQTELAQIASSIIGEKKILIGDFYSPAEVFSALAESVSEFQKSGHMPKAVIRRSPFGPAEMPPVQPDIEKISKAQALSLAGEALTFIQDFNALPQWLMVDDCRVGTGSLLALFSKMFLEIRQGSLAEEFTVVPFDAYPHENLEAIVESVEGCKSWPVHRDDLNMSHIVEMTKCQMWTLKPAHRADKVKTIKPF